MLQKQVFLVCAGSAAASLFLLSGCGEQKTKSTAKTDKVVVAAKSGKATIKTTQTPSNVAINPSFEKAKVFDSGLYKNGKTPIEKPLGWTTRGQILDDLAAWVSDEAHSGKHSLKIKNIGGTDAYWEGEPVILKQDVNAFKVSIWTKANKIAKNTGKGKFQLVLNVYIKNNGKIKVKTLNIDIPKTNHAWEKTFKNILIAENVTRIVPYLYFSGMTGTVWFDDISIVPYLDKGKILFDSNKNNIFTGKLKIISAENRKKIYKASGSQQIMSTDFIAVESDKTYKLSGMFKSMSKKKSLLYLGFVPYDKNKTIIDNYSVKYREKTETELAKKCSVNDKLIYIKDAAYWIEKSSACIAFDVDISGKYADLPNFNYSSPDIKKISFDNNNGYWIIELSKACRRAYPAGTKIREHVVDGSGTYLYSAASNIKVPGEWTEYIGIINKKNKKLFKKFHPGTTYVKLFMLANFQQSGDISLDFRDVELKETG